MTEINDEYDIASFVPNKKQQFAKHKLHTCVDPQVIGTLTIENINRIRHFFYPVGINEIIDWSLNTPVFWQWFVVANVQMFKLEELKPSAVNCLADILSGNVADSKIAGVQLTAAKLLLSLSEKPATNHNVTQNNLSIKGMQDIPKMLAKKTNTQLQDEILKLQQAVNANEGEN